jgi:hypothetical protein
MFAGAARAQKKMHFENFLQNSVGGVGDLVPAEPAVTEEAGKLDE